MNYALIKDKKKLNGNMVNNLIIPSINCTGFRAKKFTPDKKNHAKSIRIKHIYMASSKVLVNNTGMFFMQGNLKKESYWGKRLRKYINRDKNTHVIVLERTKYNLRISYRLNLTWS